MVAKRLPKAPHRLGLRAGEVWARAEPWRPCFEGFLLLWGIPHRRIVAEHTLRDNKRFRTAKILDVDKFQENPRTNVLLSHFQVSGPVPTAKSGR